MHHLGTPLLLRFRLLLLVPPRPLTRRFDLLLPGQLGQQFLICKILPIHVVRLPPYTERCQRVHRLRWTHVLQVDVHRLWAGQEVEHVQSYVLRGGVVREAMDVGVSEPVQEASGEGAESRQRGGNRGLGGEGVAGV
jgi:hypothetical protein